MFYIKTYVFIVSDCIQTVTLPASNAGTFMGESATASGWGATTQSECIDPFNSYSTDKEWLLYRQSHMDLIEVTENYVIWNPKMTLF